MPVHEPFYDWMFLATGGVGLIVIGWLMCRRATRRDAIGSSVAEVRVATVFTRIDMIPPWTLAAWDSEQSSVLVPS